MSEVILEKYHGSEESAAVDFSEKGEAITEIGAKAFLSCKSIKKLSINSSVTRIGDWAFAHMQNLEVLIVPCKEISLGKKVFLDCEKLMQIQIEGDRSDDPGTPYLLASAVRVLKKEVLCKPERAGDHKEHQRWLEDYDKALLSFLEEADEEGFEPVFIGWFRVEDIDEQIPRYLEKKRREKAQLVLQRLCFSMYLEEKMKERLHKYVVEHVPEKEKKKEHTAVYDLLVDEEENFGKEVQYFQILKECGCLSGGLIEKLLKQMKDPPAEITAFLLREQSGIKTEKNYFEEFDFDL